MAPGLGLLEREGELEQIAGVLQAASVGDGGALLIEGEAGIGKSALLAAAGRLARQHRLRVLAARGGELEGEFAYGLARQLLERELASADDHRRAQLLTGAAALAAPAVAVSPSAGSGSAPPDTFAVEHGLYWLLSNLTEERPLALLVDDLHWADVATLRFLVYLVRRLQGMALVLVCAVRLGEAGAHSVLLESLRAEPVVRAIRLQPLGEGSVARLVADGLGTGDNLVFARACREVSGGNPFMLSELIRTLAAEGAKPTADWARRVRDVGPPDVSRSVLLRLARLPDEAVALARAAAVLGNGTELRHATRLAELLEADAQRAADALAEALILKRGRPLRFHHPLVRTAIYGDLAAGRRARDHKRAGRLLADDGAPDQRVAGQLLLTEPSGDGWVVETLQAAAEAALAQGAPEAAAEYLRRALAEPPPPERRARLIRAIGSARFLAGDGEGLRLLRDALDVAPDQREWLSIVLELGSLLPLFQRTPEAVDLLERAIRRLNPDDPLVPRLQAMLALVAEFDISTSSMLDERLGPDAEQLEGTTSDERMLLATVAYRCAKRADSARAAVALAERALAGGHLFADQLTDIERSMYAIQVLVVADRFDMAAAAVEQFFVDARSRGSLMGFAGASWHRANLQHRLGALGEALTDVGNAVTAARAVGGTVQAGLGLLIDVLVERGEVDGAAAELAAAEPAGEVWMDSTSILPLWLLYGRGRLRIAQGQLSSGVEDLLELGSRCDRWGDANPAQFSWRSEAALALLRLGDESEARRLAEEEVSLARRFAAPRALAIALRALALVEGDAEGIPLLREAAQRIESSPAQQVKAKVLVELGAALRRSNQRAEARKPLQSGYELARHCEAHPLAERAREELRAIGSRPRTVIRTGADALTPSERRVCRLAAEGMTNPQIAQALFVTRATVESHLHASYRKLDIASRADLPRAL